MPSELMHDMTEIENEFRMKDNQYNNVNRGHTENHYANEDTQNNKT